MRFRRRSARGLALVASLGALAELCALGELGCRGQDPVTDTSVPGSDAAAPVDTGASAPAPLPLGAIKQIVAGDAFTCVLGTGGGVRCWGSNSLGQLGQDSAAPFRADVGEDSTIRFGTDEKVVEIAAAFETACALFERGSVRCWGGNSAGERGSGDRVSKGRAPGDMASLVPVDLGPDRSAERIFGGTRHFCVITRNVRDVLCWGNGTDQQGRYGFLGNGRPDNIGDHEGEMGSALARVPLPEPTEELALAYASTCARSTSGAVRCFGVARGGQLGNGNLAFDDPASDVHDVAKAPLTIDAGAFALFGNGPGYAAQMTDGRILTWGDNKEGRLGLGSVEDQGAPVALEARDPIVSVVSRSRHRCVILAGGDLYCFGEANYGALGYGDTMPRGHTPNTSLASMTEPVLSNVRAVAVGGHHTCALRDDGKVVCWGRNDNGQLGYGDTTDRGGQPADRASVLLPIELD